VQACAKAARSRDTHGPRGQWGDPVAEILTGGAVGLATRRTARWHPAKPGSPNFAANDEKLKCLYRAI
jgi:hypothetical protein